MIKNYVKCWINTQTGEIEHVAVRDRPYNHDPIKLVVRDKIPVSVPGQPDLISQGVDYDLEEMIIEAPKLMHAKDVIGMLESRGNRVEMKPSHLHLKVIGRKAKRMGVGVRES